MSEALHPHWRDWPATQQLAAAYKDAPEAIRFVGGCVRDALLGVPVSDVDVATILSPEDTTERLTQAGIKVIPTGLKHGTVTAVIGAKQFEITTLRTDVDCDGRHAEVRYTQDWREDAQRRDFTMNALYLSLDGTLYDEVGGKADALAGRVRFIGDARARIQEDYLRILRFFRFHARYGKAAPDAQALSACAAHSARLNEISGERLQQEMLKLLAITGCHTTCELMRQSGVLAHVLGFEVASCAALERFDRLDITLPSYVKLRVFVCASDQLDALAHRLRLSNQMARVLHLILSHCGAIPGDILAQKRLIRQLGKEQFLWLAACESALFSHDFSEVMAFAKEWRIPEFPVSGNDLKTLGFSEGKAMGDALRALENRWENSDYMLAKDTLLQEAKTLKF